jgi:hypothetical protein
LIGKRCRRNDLISRACFFDRAIEFGYHFSDKTLQNSLEFGDQTSGKYGFATV